MKSVSVVDNPVRGGSLVDGVMSSTTRCRGMLASTGDQFFEIVGRSRAQMTSRSSGLIGMVSITRVPAGRAGHASHTLRGSLKSGAKRM
jgi:hypothetical protein